MKIISQIIILILVVLSVSYNVAYAQYGNESISSSKQPTTLQKEIAVYNMQEEKHKEMEQQTQDANSAIVLMEIGIPLGAAVSFGVILFSKKRK
ncbi:MAG: hypothetical protein KGI02_03520 [Thaumarchaeota archaeon]|nr:hypothetical protein [Nitrososphaerota archaeon]MDE1877866.1 hypothetical protein [Nitrososphaerota archaeon]